METPRERLGRGIDIFTVEKGPGVKGEVLCISFELTANLFRKKCESSYPEIMG